MHLFSATAAGDSCQHHHRQIQSDDSSSDDQKNDSDDADSPPPQPVFSLPAKRRIIKAWLSEVSAEHESPPRPHPPFPDGRGLLQPRSANANPPPPQGSSPSIPRLLKRQRRNNGNLYFDQAEEKEEMDRRRGNNPAGGSPEEAAPAILPRRSSPRRKVAAAAMMAIDSPSKEHAFRGRPKTKEGNNRQGAAGPDITATVLPPAGRLSKTTIPDLPPPPSVSSGASFSRQAASVYGSELMQGHDEPATATTAAIDPYPSSAPTPSISAASFSVSTSTSTSVSRTSNTTPRRAHSRSQSPLKLGDLSFLQRPIGIRTARLPADLAPDVRPLWTPLQATASQVRILPAAIRDAPRLTGSGEGVFPWMFHDEEQEAATADTEGNGLMELLEVSEICAATLEATDRSFSEAAWNDNVHSRVLRLALASYRGVLEALNITTARLLPAFAPTLKVPQTSALAAAIVTNKMVDYSINLIPASAETASAIRSALLRPSPLGTANTVNQTSYEPATLRPAAVAIETKSETGGAADAKLKLCVWMAAWSARVRALRASLTAPDAWEREWGGDEEEDREEGEGRRWRCISQPGIIVIGAEWKLYFFVERGPRQPSELIQFPRPIGDTGTLLGTYQLLASLRELGRWVTGTFAPWLISAEGPVPLEGIDRW